MPYKWLENLTEEELKDWFTKCPTPLLRSKLDGTVVGCNIAFEREFGWNNIEFQSGNANWKDMTPINVELIEDTALAYEVATGARDEYSFFKKYKRKDGVIKDVRIHVMRRPSQPPMPLTKEEDIEFFVTAAPIDASFSVITDALTQFSVAMHSSSERLLDIKEIATTQTELIKQQTALIEKQASWWKVIVEGWKDFVTWGSNNKILFTIIVLAFLYRIVGGEAFSEAVKALNPFHPSQQTQQTQQNLGQNPAQQFQKTGDNRTHNLQESSGEKNRRIPVTPNNPSTKNSYTPVDRNYWDRLP